MSHLVRSICLDSSPKNSGDPIVFLVGTYSHLLHVIHIQKENDSQQNSLQQNSSQQNSSQQNHLQSHDIRISLEKDTIPQSDIYTESLESNESILSSLTSGTPGTEINNDNSNDNNNIENNIENSNDNSNDNNNNINDDNNESNNDINDDRSDLSPTSEQLSISSINEQSSISSSISKHMSDRKLDEKLDVHFGFTHIQTIKPSTSKLTTPPVALAMDNNEIYVAEHVTTRVLTGDSNLSSKSPFQTSSSLKKLSGDDFSYVRVVLSDIQIAIQELGLTKNFIIVVFDNSIIVIKRKNLSVVYEIPTQNSLYSTSYDSDIIAYQSQSQSQGCITIHDLNSGTISHLNGHKQKVMRFSLNQNGTLLASTSKYATLIKVFSVHDHKKLKEMRRGYKSATIYNMVFSEDSLVLAAFSSSGLHLFSLCQSDALKNTFSSLYALSYIGVTAYGGEWAAKKDTRFANLVGYGVFEPGSHTNIHFISSFGEHYSISFENVSDLKSGVPKLSKRSLHEIFDSNEKRLEQTNKMKKRFPDRIPLLLSPRKQFTSEIPIVSRNKMMIPTHMNCDQLKDVIGRQLRRVDDTIRIWIGGSIRTGHTLVNHLYDKYKDKNGFLVVEYDFIEK